MRVQPTMHALHFFLLRGKHTFSPTKTVRIHTIAYHIVER